MFDVVVVSNTEPGHLVEASQTVGLTPLQIGLCHIRSTIYTEYHSFPWQINNFSWFHNPYSENKDWPSSQQSPATAFTDLVPEFEPGKPWKVGIAPIKKNCHSSRILYSQTNYFSLCIGISDENDRGWSKHYTRKCCQKSIIDKLG